MSIPIQQKKIKYEHLCIDYGNQYTFSIRFFFKLLLTVHLSIILAINLMHKIFFYNKFIIKEDFVH